MIVRPKWDYCMKELFRNFIILKYFISDILDIPIEKIRSLKLRNTNLWRRYKYQKLPGKPTAFVVISVF